MPKITQRVLLGYSKSAIDELIRELQAEHESKCLALQREIAVLTATNKQLLANINSRKEQLRTHPASDDHQTEPPVPAAELQQALTQFCLLEQQEQEIATQKRRQNKAVAEQVLQQLRSLETLIQQRMKEGG